MQMTKAQKRQFYEEGYVLVRGAVPKLMADQARKAINRHMRFKVMAQGRNPGLSSEPVITDLFNKSPLWGLCESVVGDGKLIAPRGGNVKLNFPDAEERPLRGWASGFGWEVEGWVVESRYHAACRGSGPRCSATVYGQFLFLAGVPSRF